MSAQSNAGASDAQDVRDRRATATLVVELVTEELPPKALKALGAAFAERSRPGCNGARSSSDASVATSYATPRRLAVAITDVRAVAPDASVVDKLMPAKVARDAHGQPSEALKKKLAALGRPHLATASLDAVGRARSDLRRVRRQGGLRLSAQPREGPAARRERCRKHLTDAIERLPIPKVMRYAGARQLLQRRRSSCAPRTGCSRCTAPTVDSRHRARPRRRTRDRGPSLPVARRHRRRNRRSLCADARGGGQGAARIRASAAPRSSRQLAGGVATARRSIMPDALLDEVTALVEWPAVYAGTFDPAFLAVPQECLILTMQQNQKYFALADARGMLTHRFLMVSNLADAAIRARSCAATSACCARGSPTRGSSSTRTASSRSTTRVDQARRHRLSQQARHARRSRRALALPRAQHRPADRRRSRAVPTARRCSPRPTSSPTWWASSPSCRARWAATTRSTTARRRQSPTRSRSTTGRASPAMRCPRHRLRRRSRSPTSSRRSPGCSASAQLPTGDKDPFGLRRAGDRRAADPGREAAAACRCRACWASRSRRSIGCRRTSRVPEALADFLYDRLRGYLREQGYTANQVEAVLVAAAAARSTSCPTQLAAVKAFEALPEADALSAANKRIVNILRRAAARRPSASTVERLTDGAERDLWQAFEALAPEVDRHCASGDYTSALQDARDRQARRRPLLRRRDGDGRRSGDSREPARAAARRRGDDEPRRRHLEARRLTSRRHRTPPLNARH